MHTVPPGAGRPLVLYDPSNLLQGNKSMYPSILRYAPGLQEFPDELLR